ncbi:hypothetical protein C1645_832083, partial [Glomus cerebriforme]
HIPLFSAWIDKKDSSYYNKRNIPYEFKLLYRSSQDGFNAASFHRNCYNPLDWSGSHGYKNTADSFLFNLTDGNNISTARLGYVIKASHAVFCCNNQGPSIPKKFTVENFEIFQVIKK